MSAVARPRLVHVTTTDMSLELLLGPQLEAFASAGYEVIGVSAPGDFVDAIEARGIEHVALANATRSMDLRSDLAALGELRRLFGRLSPAIVHTHNPKPGLYGRLAAASARVPVVVNTVHGLYALPDDPLAKRAVVYSLERIASTFSDGELVQNPEDITTLRRVLHEPTAKVALLGNGVDLERFGCSRTEMTTRQTETRRRIRAELELVDEDVVVGAVGRLVLEKGYAELFEAWEQVRRATPRARLVVVGPDDEAKSDAVPRELLDRAEAGGVRLLGMRSDVEDIYLALDAYVLASHREGFPRSAMEAAASGLPIVATDIRGCRQVVDHGVTGLLVEVRSAAALAGAITRLVSDPELRSAMSRAATSRATLEFDQERVIERTLTTYERLLRAQGLAPPGDA